MTTPTPDEVAKATDLWDSMTEEQLLDGDVAIPAISTALRDAVAAERERWAAFADEKGEPRKVQGHGLAISADGVVLTTGARVWTLDDTDLIDGEPFDGWVVLSVDRGECETQRFRWVTISGIGETTAHSLYASREAALAAKGQQ